MKLCEEIYVLSKPFIGASGNRSEYHPNREAIILLGDKPVAEVSPWGVLDGHHPEDHSVESSHNRRAHEDYLDLLDKEKPRNREAQR